jgi:hypothetical protein
MTLLPIFINKVLLEHSLMKLFSCYNCRAEFLQNRPSIWLAKLKIFTICVFAEMLANHWLNLTHQGEIMSASQPQCPV